MNDVFKFIYNSYLESKKGKRWYPVLGVFYLSYSCKLRCFYCSDGDKNPYHTLPQEKISTSEVISVLKEIRKNVNHLVITGGEPLDYEGLEQILSTLKELKFKTLVLTTNGINFDTYVSQINECFTEVVFSVDTLDRDKSARMYGTDKVTIDSIFSNIELAKNLERRKFSINISSVVTTQNISDLYEVEAWADSNNFSFAACPQLHGVTIKEELHNNSEYRAFYNYLIAKKRAGNRIFGTRTYLSYMRDIKKFQCYPMTMLVVSPSGEVFYPCLEKGSRAGNITEASLHTLRKQAQKMFGEIPTCGNQCQSACALSYGLAISKPLSLLTEPINYIKGIFKR